MPLFFDTLCYPPAKLILHVVYVRKEGQGDCTDTQEDLIVSTLHCGGWFHDIVR